MIPGILATLTTTTGKMRQAILLENSRDQQLSGHWTNCRMLDYNIYGERFQLKLSSIEKTWIIFRFVVPTPHTDIISFIFQKPSHPKPLPHLSFDIL